MPCRPEAAADRSRHAIGGDDEPPLAALRRRARFAAIDVRWPGIELWRAMKDRLAGAAKIGTLMEKAQGFVGGT